MPNRDQREIVTCIEGVPVYREGPDFPKMVADSGYDPDKFPGDLVIKSPSQL